MKTSVIIFYSKGDTVIFLISTLILLHNVFITQFIIYRILSRTCSFWVAVYRCSYSFPRSICPNIKVTSRVSRQTPFPKHFHFFVVLELQWSLRLICYIFNPLNTEFRSRKKTHFLSNISFLDRFSASTVISIEMAKNEIFSYCLFCFWNGNCWLCWDLFINGWKFNGVTWTPVPPFFRA